MLPPNYLINHLSPITTMYSDLHTSVLEDIARHIADTMRATSEAGLMPSAAYQVERLQATGLLRGKIISRIAKINKMSRKEVRKLFEDAAIKTRWYDNIVYRAAGMVPTPLLQSSEMLRILDAGISKANGSIERLTGTIAINSQDKFEQLLNLGYNKVASGSFSYQEAIASTVDDLAREGIGTMDYATGRSISIEAGVRRAVLTGANQTAAKITEETMKELGVSLVRTSAHQGARTHSDGGFKDHTTWQGKVFYWPNMEKGLQNNLNSDILKSSNIEIGRSLGAQAKNYEVMLPNGEAVNLTEGSRITNQTVVAGKGRDRQIDIVDLLVDKYGGAPDEWQKMKGFGYVDHNGESLKAELHWYQEPTIGKVMWKIKPQKGGELFIYED